MLTWRETEEERETKKERQREREREGGREEERLPRVHHNPVSASGPSAALAHPVSFAEATPTKRDIQ